MLKKVLRLKNTARFKSAFESSWWFWIFFLYVGGSGHLWVGSACSSCVCLSVLLECSGFRNPKRCNRGLRCYARLLIGADVSVHGCLFHEIIELCKLYSKIWRNQNIIVRRARASVWTESCCEAVVRSVLSLCGLVLCPCLVSGSSAASCLNGYTSSSDRRHFTITLKRCRSWQTFLTWQTFYKHSLQTE